MNNHCLAPSSYAAGAFVVAAVVVAEHIPVYARPTLWKERFWIFKNVLCCKHIFLKCTWSIFETDFRKIPHFRYTETVATTLPLPYDGMHYTIVDSSTVAVRWQHDNSRYLQLKIMTKWLLANCRRGSVEIRRLTLYM